jgi:glycosyltransferase involved in cell wall biosynthesis
MKNLLFLTPSYPYEVRSGGMLKTSKMLTYLSKHYHLTVICFKFINISKTQSYLQEESINNLRIITCNITKERNTRNLKNYLSSIFKDLPLSVYRNFDPLLFNLVQSEIDKNDVVLCDHFIMYQYLLHLESKKIVLHQHNAEYIMWERTANLTSNLLKKMVLKLEVKRLKKYEAAICTHATKVLAAPNDINALKKIVSKNNFESTYHLGDDSLLSIPNLNVKNHKNQNIIFLGSMNWFPNYDGVNWFLLTCWKKILNRYPDSTFSIIGDCPEEIKNKLELHTNVHVLGFVESLVDCFINSRVFICPLQVGSGMKVKNTTAMYSGLPIVTTSIGIEGFNVINKKHCIISDSSNGFIDGISLLFDNDEIWSSISSNSKNLASLEYSWDMVLSNINKVIDSVS